MFVEFLRANISEVTRSGLADRTRIQYESFTGDGTTTEYSITVGEPFPLTFPITFSPDHLQAITSVTVASVSQKKYLNYGIDLRNAKITFVSAPANGAAITVNYVAGTAWIHRDKERTEENWTASSFPKIVVNPITESGIPLGISDDDYWDNMVFQVDILSRKDQKCTISSETKEGQYVADYLARRVRESIKQGDARTDLLHKFSHPVVLRNDPAPFDESKNVFRRIIEVQMSGMNAGM